MTIHEATTADILLEMGTAEAGDPPPIFVIIKSPRLHVRAEVGMEDLAELFPEHVGTDDAGAFLGLRADLEGQPLPLKMTVTLTPERGE